MIPREPEEREKEKAEAGAEKAEADIAAIEDVEALRKLLAEQKEKAERYLSNWQRAEADLINYRRRSEQEKEGVSKFANCALVLSLLPVLDDFERAFNSMPPELASLPWVDGVRLIERKLRSTLEMQGLSQIKAEGQPFDPYQHEAVRQDKGKEGIVIQEVQKGYKFRDRVIRPSKVVVGSGEETSAGMTQ